MTDLIKRLADATRRNTMIGGDDREAFGRDVRKSCFDALEITRMGAFMGIPIHVVPDAIARITVPVKEHKDRGKVVGHGLFANGYVRRPSAYHLRIQKKWNKRYGFKTVDRVYFMDQLPFDQMGNAHFGPTKPQKVMVVGETYFQRIYQEARDLGVMRCGS